MDKELQPFEAMNARMTAFFRECSEHVYEEPETYMHKEITRIVVAALLNRFPPDASLAVLDVGCGPGYATEEFIKKEHTVTAITLSEPERQRMVIRFKKRVLCLTESQNDLPGDWSESFDVVFARHVLEHSPIPFFTLKEFRRVLRREGLLYAEMPAPDTDCKHEGNLNHYSVLGHRMWKSLIWRSGFVVLETQSFDFMTPAGKDTYFNFTAKKP